MIPTILTKDLIDNIKTQADFNLALMTIKQNIWSCEYDFKETTGARKGLKKELISAAKAALKYLKETRPEFFI